MCSHFVRVYIIKCLDMCSSNFVCMCVWEGELGGHTQQESYIGIWIFIRVRKKFINKTETQAAAAAVTAAALRPERNMCNQNIRVYCTLYTFRTLQSQMHSFKARSTTTHSPTHQDTPIQSRTFTHPMHSHSYTHTITNFHFIGTATEHEKHSRWNWTHLHGRAFHSFIPFHNLFLHSFIHLRHHLFISINALHRLPASKHSRRNSALIFFYAWHPFALMCKTNKTFIYTLLKYKYLMQWMVCVCVCE